jgi:uncharacterized protein
MDLGTFNRRLESSRPYKPLDFGNGLLAGSVAPNGRLININTYHSLQGYVTLSSTAPFPDAQRNDPAAVRAYRAAQAQPDAATFGLSGAPPEQAPEVCLLADSIPRSRFRSAGVDVEVTTWAPRPGGQAVPCAAQIWRLHNHGDRPASWGYAWGGTLALSRASYTQLTEQGSIPLPNLALELHFDGHALLIVTPDAGAVAAVLGLPPGPAWHERGQGTIALTIRGQLIVPPGQTVEQTLVYALGQRAEQVSEAAATLARTDLLGDLAAALDARRARWRGLDPGIPAAARPLAHRAQSYILDCCALPVGDATCLLTDHQILPLSWTRDAYYMLQGMVVDGRQTDLDLWRRHLLWLFEIAQRPGGYWGRAYLANGRPKDSVFQLDQQCYPLLELAEYAGAGGDQDTVARLARQVPAILEAILARRAAQASLFATEETPADDPLPLPYHFSSQVLVWHTLRRLAALSDRWPGVRIDLAGLAEEVRAAARERFVAEHHGRRLFAYAIDLHGAQRLYHDANDLPTVLAPAWGFCPADDPTWRATLDFAFGPENRGGYYPGPLGGLGSLHTPAPWPLGDVQELLYARSIGDAPRADEVLSRLAASACWDGALPEARDSISGAVRSRHWFAWPGAALVAALAHPAWRAARSNLF